MKLTKRRRENVAKFFFSLAQIIFAVFIIGRVMSPAKISLAVFLSSIFVFIGLAFLGYLIDNGGEQ